jgi:peptidyl-prolyl cis-trans isomerase SurA
MKRASYSFPCLVAVLILGCVSLAQETQTRVVDEVVAQVNNSVITASGVRRETKNAVDSLVQEGKKRDEAQKLVDEKQGELIANLINEQLLIDKAKDIGLDKEIDDLVNQKLAELMKQLNVKTVEAVYAEMERNGFNPADLKDSWRRQFIKDQVIQREVQGKLYWGFSGKELQDYYESHKDKFTKPETVSFSELFLGFAGRDEQAVREKAKQLYSQLKAGGDWAKLVQENGDRGAITQGAGTVDKAPVKELSPMVAEPIKNLKVGDVTYPFEIRDMGVVMLKIDAREQASNESVFNENAVRFAMMSERFPDEQKKYMAKLREMGYVQINDTYRPLVSPILYADERKETPKETKNQKTGKPAEAPAKTTKTKDKASPESSSQKTTKKDKEKQGN